MHRCVVVPAAAASASSSHGTLHEASIPTGENTQLMAQGKNLEEEVCMVHRASRSAATIRKASLIGCSLASNGENVNDFARTWY